MKKLLILGGTNFIGRNLVAELEHEGEYEITLLQRGVTNTELFPQMRRIQADRNTEQIRRIREFSWDIVVDLSCYYPASLQAVLENLNADVERYVFVSTCSVFDHSTDRSVLRRETDDLLPCSAKQAEDSSPDTYGNRKAECERLLGSSGISSLIIRPALVYGKFDPTDRFYYWLYQVKHFDRLLVPDNGERLFSLTYVRDLVACFRKALASDSFSGVYSLTSHPQSSIRAILDAAARHLQREPEIVSAAPEYLRERDVREWFDMPLWIDGDFCTYSNSRYLTDFQISPTDFLVSVAETIAYFEALGWPTPQYGMTKERRYELLQNLI